MQCICKNAGQHSRNMRRQSDSGRQKSLKVDLCATLQFQFDATDALVAADDDEEATVDHCMRSVHGRRGWKEALTMKMHVNRPA